MDLPTSEFPGSAGAGAGWWRVVFKQFILVLTFQVILQKAIKDAYAKGFLGKNIFLAADTISIFTGTAAPARMKLEKSRR